MKRIVWIITVVVAVGYFVSSYMVNRARLASESAEAEKIEQATKTAVSQMASRTNAVTDWESVLSKGERFRFEPILTFELERLWLQQRPILFFGAIRDIATHGQSQYMVLVERNLFGSFSHFFGTALQLSLLAERTIVESFLEQNPDLFQQFGLKNGVAVVARINSIKTTDVTVEGGEREEMKIGDGQLLEIVYTGAVKF